MKIFLTLVLIVVMTISTSSADELIGQSDLPAELSYTAEEAESINTISETQKVSCAQRLAQGLTAFLPGREHDLGIDELADKLQPGIMTMDTQLSPTLNLLTKSQPC